MIASDAEDFDIEDPPPPLVFDCGHQHHGLRREYDLLDGTSLEWSSAILCESCKNAINDNPDDPRETFPSGTRDSED